MTLFKEPESRKIVMIPEFTLTEELSEETAKQIEQWFDSFVDGEWLSNSYPHRSIARQYGINYADVLLLADLNRGLVENLQHSQAAVSRIACQGDDILQSALFWVRVVAKKRAKDLTTREAATIVMQESMK